MTYSQLAYKWLPAENWPRPSGAGVRAIAIHHAEGGGTAGWLTRADGNSSHYVVEYTGKIVAQVHEQRAAGSMKASLTRTNDDAPFEFLGERIVYGRTALNKALGSFATNPNAAVIAIEVEGFAKDGPNPAQRAALAKLVADIRTRYNAIPCIGHRDQQNYKACPGKRIPWADYGGHAVRTNEVPDMPLELANFTPKRVTIPAETVIYLTDGSVLKTIHTQVIKDSPVGVFLNGVGYRLIDAIDGDNTMLAMVRSKDVTSTAIVPVPDVSGEGSTADDGFTAATQAAAVAEAKVEATAAEKARLAALLGL